MMNVVIKNFFASLLSHYQKSTSNMERENKSLSRKRFLVFGFGITSLLAVPAFLKVTKKKKDLKTVKMLTQDGKLVEIEITNVPAKKKKLKDAEIHTWVNKNTSSL